VTASRDLLPDDPALGWRIYRDWTAPSGDVWIIEHLSYRQLVPWGVTKKGKPRRPPLWTRTEIFRRPRPTRRRRH
jgi:hypothetical protein